MYTHTHTHTHTSATRELVVSFQAKTQHADNVYLLYVDSQHLGDLLDLFRSLLDHSTADDADYEDVQTVVGGKNT